MKNQKNITSNSLIDEVINTLSWVAVNGSINRLKSFVRSDVCLEGNPR